MLVLACGKGEVDSEKGAGGKCTLEAPLEDVLDCGMVFVACSLLLGKRPHLQSRTWHDAKPQQQHCMPYLLVMVVRYVLDTLNIHRSNAELETYRILHGLLIPQNSLSHTTHIQQSRL